MSVNTKAKKRMPQKLTISEAGVDFIKDQEGLRLKAYQDQGGTWTIGYGHTKTAKKGLVITRKRAGELLQKDLVTPEKVVQTQVVVPLAQYQYDALVSFVLNCGSGAFKKSTLLKRINDKEAELQIAEAWRWWNKITNEKRVKVISLGLVIRRTQEIRLFRTGNYTQE